MHVEGFLWFLVCGTLGHFLFNTCHHLQSQQCTRSGRWGVLHTAVVILVVTVCSLASLNVECSDWSPYKESIDI